MAVAGLQTDEDAVDAWLVAASEGLCGLERGGRLPAVSSALSWVVSALRRAAGADGEVEPGCVRAAMRALAEGYAAVLRGAVPGLAGSRRPLRVLSLCTGYDAAVELLAVHAALGPIAGYVSVDVDPRAAATNRSLTAGSPLTRRCQALTADVRDARAMRRVVDAAGGFDVCLVLRPPIFPTRYGDTRRGGLLSPAVHPSIALELLLLKVEGVLAMPVCVVVHHEREGDRLARLAAVFGDEVRRTTVTHASPVALTLHAALLP